MTGCSAMTADEDATTHEVVKPTDTNELKSCGEVS